MSDPQTAAQSPAPAAGPAATEAPTCLVCQKTDRMILIGEQTTLGGTPRAGYWFCDRCMTPHGSTRLLATDQAALAGTPFESPPGTDAPATLLPAPKKSRGKK